MGLIWEVAKCVKPNDVILSLCLSCSMPEHPESFPVNALVPIPGTPLENNEVINVMLFLGL